MIDIKIPDKPNSLIPINKPNIKINSEDYVWNKLILSLEQEAAKLIGGISKTHIKIEEPHEGIEADLAFATHPFAKTLKTDPKTLAETAINKFAARKEDFPTISGVKQIGPYVNFEIDPNVFGKLVVEQIEEMGESYGNQNVGNGKSVVLDTSSPNIAKFMSIGHLRSTVIGESLARIYKSLGYTSIRDNHIGDWGTQFGMLGAAYEKWGNEIPELKSKNERDIVNGLYKIYVKMHQEIEKEKENSPDGESELEKLGRMWFEKLEKGDNEAKNLWKWALDISIKEFKKIYDLLDVQFEYIIGESQYVSMNKEIINLLLNKKIAEKDKTGAIIVKFDKKGENKLVIQKSDGTSLYSTRDLGTIFSRELWFNPEKILYIVGVDQKHYFEQIFKIYKNLTNSKVELKHIYFGIIKLPQGKMSTRKGNVIFLEEFLQKAISKVKEKVKENNNDLPESELNKIAKAVGIGAVKFFDLGQSRERDIKFDWDKALSFEGIGSPYVQYAYTRALSILRNAEKENITINESLNITFNSTYEKALIKELAKLPVVIKNAFQLNQPSKIAEYVYKLASLFNQFYKNSPVIEASNDLTRNSRLRITKATSVVIKKSLYLLGIDVPERM